MDSKDRDEIARTVADAVRASAMTEHVSKRECEKNHKEQSRINRLIIDKLDGIRTVVDLHINEHDLKNGFHKDQEISQTRIRSLRMQRIGMWTKVGGLVLALLMAIVGASFFFAKMQYRAIKAADADRLAQTQGDQT